MEGVDSSRGGRQVHVNEDAMGHLGEDRLTNLLPFRILECRRRLLACFGSGRRRHRQRERRTGQRCTDCHEHASHRISFDDRECNVEATATSPIATSSAA
jgi:hypothetical protein